MGTSKVVVDIIAPNSRTFNMLEFVLQQHGKGRFELGRGNRPDLIVADFDKPDDKIAFRKHRSRFPDVPAVVLLNQSVEYEALVGEARTATEFVLLKPFAAKDFIAKIDECLGGTSGAVARTVGAASKVGKSASLPPVSGGASKPPLRANPAVKAERTVTLQTSNGTIQAARPAIRQRGWEALENDAVSYSFAFDSDIDMADESAVKKMWLKTDNKLLGYFKSVISQQKSAQSPICLSVNGGPNFYLSPYARKVAVAGEPVNLQELARQEFGERKITVSECGKPEGNIQWVLGMEAFLWKLALYTYRGYLPEGIDVNKPVYLRYWPNLTRLEPTPNAMRIASLLNRQPVPLAFIVRILNLPQRHVFNFFSAANAIGFAGPAVREVDNMFLPSYPDELANYQTSGLPGKALKQGARQ